MTKHIMHFLETNKLLYAHQHGFRRGLSTVTQLIETVHDFSVALDEQRQTDVICVDFRKAFDKVSHSKLIFKLRQVGVAGDVLEWIESYLTGRRQVVRVSNCVSGFLDVFSGVPQGSVLGPLLFLIYINDVVAIVQPPVVLKLFADDCLLYGPVTCENDQVNINQCLERLYSWCDKWDMEINYAKTTFAHITRKKNVFSSSIALEMLN